MLSGPGYRDKLGRCIQHVLILMESPVTDICEQRVAVIESGQNKLYHRGNEYVMWNEWSCLSENTKSGMVLADTLLTRSSIVNSESK